jgi:hypothetical protein
MGRRKMGKYNIKGTQVRWATPTKASIFFLRAFLSSFEGVF